MEAFSLCLLFLAILYASIYLIFLRRQTAKLPPGSSGWPIFGENLNLVSSGPEKFISERIQKFSAEVFRTSLMGEKMAVFCGPEGNRFLFSNENKLLTTWWPESIGKPLAFPIPASQTQKEATLEQRTSIVEILKPDSLKQYIPVMDFMAQEHLEKEWAPFHELKLYPLSKKYTFDLACRLFLGIEDPEEVKKLFDPFILVSSGLFSLPIELPGTPYNRSLKAGKMIKEQLVGIVKQRRKELMETKEKPGSDLVSRLVLARGDNGRYLNEVEIASRVTSLLVASYETTSAAITSVLKYLSELPHIYDEVHKEQMEIAKSKGPKELLNWDDVQKMKYTWNVACEALRLIPPAQGSFREAITDFTYAGFTIPKGWKTFWNVYSTHKNAKYFSNPEKFDPSRFEGKGPAPYTYVPFGGGPRMCPGKEYSRLELLVFIHNVVKKFKLEKLIADEKIIYRASPVPAHGLPVRLYPHEK